MELNSLNRYLSFRRKEKSHYYDLFTRKMIVLSLFVFLFSCFSTETSDPEKAYKYWAGQSPPEDLKLIKGEYYQSPHYTLEYEFFLKFKPTNNWWNAFIEQNNLEEDSLNEEWFKHDGFPKWFKPDNSYLIYSKNDEFDRSRCFINLENGVCYIYETVGM